jgi:hypothetical protein
MGGSGGSGNGLVALNGGTGGILHLDFAGAANGNDPYSQSGNGTAFGSGINVLNGLNLGSGGIIMLALLALTAFYLWVRS